MTSLVDRLTHSRVWRSFFRHGWPDNARDRALVMTTNVFFHLHPVKINRASLRATYTFGLGLVTAIAFASLVVTGALLMFWYAPTVERAYPDILSLQTAVPYGQLLRNLHRWGAHLMVLTAVLHLARVFYTGAYKPPREFNWVVGVGLLALTLAGSFTGYLLPWDQLAFWAVTVGTSLASHLPGIGADLQAYLLGGPEVGQAALLRFYALHVMVIPLALALLTSVHFWRVRKDGGLAVPKIPRDTVLAFPVVAVIEVMLTLAVSLGLLLLSLAVDAPLEAVANPNLTPDPSKAPWYFVGLQEMLEHGHPFVMAIAGPLLAGLFVAAVPYLDPAETDAGVWFGSRRGAWITALSAVYTLVGVPALVVLSNAFPPRELLRGQAPEWVAQALIPGGATVLFTLAPLLALGVARVRPTRREALLVLFTLLLVTAAVVTVIGFQFRGPGFELYWPWQMPDGYNPWDSF